MKRFVVSLAVAFIATFAAAQNLSSAPEHHGWSQSHGFGGPYFKLTSINDDLFFLYGGGGAWKIGSHFYFGGKGYYGSGSTTVPASADVSEATKTDIDYGYGGLMAGVNWHVHDHLTIDVHVSAGMGGIDYSYNQMIQEQYFSYFAPNILLNYRLSEWIYAGLGYSYMWNNMSSGPMNSDAIRKSGFNLNFNFGNF